MVLHLRNSRIELFFDVVVHSSALLALTQIDAPVIGLVFAALLISISFSCVIRRWIRDGSNRIEEVVMRNGAWELTIDGCWVEVMTPNIRFFSEFFIVLAFKDFQGGSYRLLIFPDSLKREELLRFRKYLRFEFLTH